MTTSLKKLQAGERKPAAVPPVYTAADIRAFQAFSARPGYAMLNRFNEGLQEQMRANDSTNQKVTDIHIHCSIATDNTRRETSRPPTTVK